MSYLGDKDFYLEVAKGNVAKHSGVNKFGRNSAVGTSEEDIWDGGGTWVPPTTARTHNIVSDSPNDDLGSSGAETLTIYGLDAAGAKITEDIEMDGTNPVTTSNTFTMIYRMIVTLGTNEGTITATANTDSTVTAQINIGFNQTLMAIYKIPAGTTGYLLHYYATQNQSTAGSLTAVDVALYTSTNGTDWVIKHFLGMSRDGSSFLHYDYSIPLQIPAGTFVKIAGDASATTDVTAGFDIIEVLD